MTALTPDYLRTPIPSLHVHLFGYSYTNMLDTIFCRTDKYKSSFFPDSIILWNDIGPQLRGAESISIFKNKILKLYRPAKKCLFNIHDYGIKWIFLKSHKT